MKYFNKKIRSQNIKDLRERKSHDPLSMETYYKGVSDLANGFNREWANTGILDLNDIVQECYYLLAKTWPKMDWDAIHELPQEEQQPFIWHYLKTTINLQVRDKINDQADGIRIPHNKRWELTETKDVYDFLTQLFPTSWFWENDEKLNFIDEPPERWDNVQLRESILLCMDKLLTAKEKDVLCMRYGIGEDKMSSKEVAKHLKITVSNVDWTRQHAVKKLKNEEVKGFLEDFYTFS